MIYEEQEGFIVANSRYNVVNYRNGLIAIHIRYLISPPQYEFYYDAIKILDSTGKQVGKFYFRDLAKFICDYIINRMKAWQYFRLYFATMTRAVLTSKRYIMLFPINSPLGMEIISLSPSGWTIHPEYWPQRKIPAGVYAYNFSVDTGYSEHEFYRDFSAEGAFNLIQSSPGMPVPTSNFTGSYAYILGDGFDKIFVFEPIAVLPVAALDGSYWESEKILRAVQARRTDKSLLNAFGITFRGFHNKWLISPSGVQVSALFFIGLDSAIECFKIDIEKIDEVLDKAILPYKELMSYNIGGMDIGSLIKLIEYMQLKFEFTLENSKQVIDILWRLGPPMWMVTMYDMRIGYIAYIETQYDNSVYILNDTPLYVGDLEFKMSRYTTQMVRSGNDMFVASWDSSEGNYKLRRCVWGLPTVAVYDYGKYYYGPRTLVLTSGSDVALMFERRGDLASPPINHIKAILGKPSVRPTRVEGLNALLWLSKDGSVDSQPVFGFTRFAPPNEDKTHTETGISIVESAGGGINFSIPINAWVDEMQGAYGSMFVSMNDGVGKIYVFCDILGGYITTFLTTRSYSNWYMKSINDFVRFDRFLASSYDYDIITIAEADKEDGVKKYFDLVPLRYLEGEVI